MVAELQLVMEPYFEGRSVSHLLFKIGRCDTGGMEMVRDFFQEYFHEEAARSECLQQVKDIALAVKEGRKQPERAKERYEARPFEDDDDTQDHTEAFKNQIKDLGHVVQDLADVSTQASSRGSSKEGATKVKYCLK